MLQVSLQDRTWLDKVLVPPTSHLWRVRGWVHQPGVQFLHRANWDGTFASICRECFSTVATVKREPDLDKAEAGYGVTGKLIT